MANKLFTREKINAPKTSRHDLSHDVKLSTRMGRLTPVSVFEALPGDKFDLQAHSMIRFAPLVSPAMHRFDVYLHSFFVPNRILWHNWENFITNTPVGGEIPVVPKVTMPSSFRTEGSLADYLGIPTAPNAGTIEVSALPFAAYACIYNEYYRDENLVNEVKSTLNSARGTYLVDGTSNDHHRYRELQYRAWEHDYFTSCLPWAQKGDAATIPLGSTDPALVMHNSGSQQNTYWSGDRQGQGVDVMAAGANNPNMPSDFLYSEGADVEPTTINSLRRAYALQRWLEKMARGGSRYVEYVRAHFNQFTGDARLNRPEFIYGTKSPVQVSEVLQTSESSETPQANMAGHGVSISSGKNGSYKVKEHGFIMTIMSIMPKTAYQQGLHKMWSRESNLDYYQPDFAHIGEQEVKNKELMLTANPSYNDGTFGYIPRYSEYKFVNSRVAGDFKDTLRFWHEGRIFEEAAPPVLNQSFIEARPEGANPSIRNDIFAVKTGDNLWCHVYMDVKAHRRMPYYGTPI